MQLLAFSWPAEVGDGSGVPVLPSSGVKVGIDEGVSVIVGERGCRRGVTLVPNLRELRSEPGMGSLQLWKLASV